MSKSLTIEVVTRLEPLVEKHYQLNKELVKAFEEVPLNKARGSCGTTPDIPPICYPPRYISPILKLEIHLSQVIHKLPPMSTKQGHYP